MYRIHTFYIVALVAIVALATLGCQSYGERQASYDAQSPSGHCPSCR